jgi:hypothetical protein
MSQTNREAASYLRQVLDRYSQMWSTKSERILETKTFPNEVLVHDTASGKHWKLTVTEYRGPRRPAP